VASVRWVDTELERPRWRGTLNYRLLTTLQVGIEFNPMASEAGPLATWFVVTEGARHPAVFLGTSSDRIGSPPYTESYYVTAAKALGTLPASAYVSLAWSDWDDAFNVPFGAHIDLGHGFGLQPMYDGHRSHLLATWSRERFSVTAIAAWLERAGLAVSVGF
jgi:hypothetical protein